LTASGASTYSWLTTGNVNTASISVSPLSSIGFSVVGTATNNCQNIASATVSVALCSGINESEFGKDQILIYPNPASDKITLTSNNDITLQVIAISGQVIRSVTLNQKNGHKTEIINLAPGTYLLKDTQGIILKQKIVITE